MLSPSYFLKVFSSDEILENEQDPSCFLNDFAWNGALPDFYFFQGFLFDKSP